MTRTVKIGGALVVGVFVLALLTLRLVGFEPQYLDPGGEEFAAQQPDCQTRTVAHGRGVPGGGHELGLRQQPRRPGTPRHRHARDPHVVRHTPLRHHRHRRTRRQAQHPCPIRTSVACRRPSRTTSYWTRNVSRDPRVRLKMGDKIYEATVALMTDRDEVAGVMGRDPVTVDRGPDGREHVTVGHALLARVPAERRRLLGGFAGGRLLTSAGRVRALRHVRFHEEPLPSTRSVIAAFLLTATWRSRWITEQDPP